MKIQDVKQGSEQWHALRATTRNASEAPAMMGVSKYKSRPALIAEKATGIVPEIDAATQRRFDAGHETEAKARAILEEKLGEDLYPLVATDDEVYLLASSDGSDMCRTFGFEHKLWNEEIADQVSAGEVPDSHKWQLDQQIAVFGFEKIIFVCSDGTTDNFVSCEYRTTPERIEKLRAGWKMFDQDVANYQPEVIEAKPILTANPIDHLPALVIEVTGRVAHSNLVEFKAAAVAVIKSIKTELVTDQDFVDAKAAEKYLDTVEKNAVLAKQNALDQTASIAALHRTLDEIIEMSAKVRIKLGKDIVAQNAKQKEEIVLKARNDLIEHCRILNARIGGFMPAVTADFAGATKNLRSLDSMREKVGNVLREAQYQTSQTADRIEANIKSLEGEGQSWRFLFPDLMAVCNKAPDDFAALLAARKASHKEAEAKRIEQIRAEEQAKAQREAEQKAQMAEHERLVAERAAQAEANRLAAEEIRRIDEQRKAEAMAVAQQLAEETKAAMPDEAQKQPAADHIEQPLVLVVSENHAPVNDCLPRIKLGEICARLGYTVSAEFLATMGFEPVATDKNAKLYNEASFPGICRRISDHTLRIGMSKKAA